MTVAGNREVVIEVVRMAGIWSYSKGKNKRIS